MTLKLLIVGGYGTFGGRIVELLETEPSLEIIVCGRSPAKAQAFCATRGATAAKLIAGAFDREGDLTAQLAAHAPNVVVDASGPFQAYGDGRYRLIEACVAARVNYLDLADAAGFVTGVSAFDKAAREAGVFVLSGVSSFPVLTAAVVRRLSRDMARVDSISGGIAPSPYAGVGENVVRAIASYAGQPVAYLGRTAKIIGKPFTQQRRYTIAPPGRVPLRSTLFSLVDVPDLRALSALRPEVRRVWMGAGPVPEVLHRGLIALSWLVAIGWMRTLAPLAPLMHWATNRVRWGEHRGGMFVEARGALEGGATLTRSWHLLAEGSDGPLIPSMAVEAIVRRQIAGAQPVPGARAATQEIELDDYEKLFATRTIYTGERETPPRGAPLYQRLLGGAWDGLPRAVREMHDGVRRAIGSATVERGGNWLARAAAAMMSFPPAGDYDVSVVFHADAMRETWRRSFGRFMFSSLQYEGEGRSERLLCERFGALEFSMAMVLDTGALRLVVRRWRAFGVPLPLWLAPHSHAYETEENGAFRFHVEISHPLVGLIVRYRGLLRPASAAREAS
ncbi:hypothetical protein U91I_03667 [alpha proteobacterium U9-1i]|nr:hypothetical protein U91I_03667 [alpha proteobacterium U9-1i]